METKIIMPDLSKQKLYQILPRLEMIAKFHRLKLSKYKDFLQALDIYSAQLN